MLTKYENNPGGVPCTPLPLALVEGVVSRITITDTATLLGVVDAVSGGAARLIIRFGNQGGSTADAVQHAKLVARRTENPGGGGEEKGKGQGGRKKREGVRNRVGVWAGGEGRRGRGEAEGSPLHKKSRKAIKSILPIACTSTLCLDISRDPAALPRLGI